MNNFQFPFGGLPVIFAGDFNQLGPVKKTFIPKDMMTWALRRKLQNESLSKLSTQSILQNESSSSCHHSTPQRAALDSMKKSLQTQLLAAGNYSQQQDKKTVQAAETEAHRFKPGSLPYQGCLLFSSLERYHLYEQKRAANDVTHKDFVQRLSNGQPICMKDIENYKHLSREDIIDHPDEWKYAPILVSTNIERLNIARYKAQLWAKDHNTYVFKWCNRVRKEVNRPTQQYLSKILEANAFFWQFWVAGAPANLSNNINCELALVNGSPVTCHSLTFADDAEFQRVQDLILGADPPPFGSEIVIDVPASVNVQIEPTLDQKPISLRRQRQLDMMIQTITSSTSNGNNATHSNIVIPLTASMTSSSYCSFSKFSYNSENPITPIASAEVRQPFPYDLSFAITVWKTQGRTMKRVVLDANFHDNHYSRLSFEAIFVAKSRVQFSKHIRLLGRHGVGKCHSITNAYGYLSHLQPCADTSAFYSGYDASDPVNTWDFQKALKHSSTSPNNTCI
jgi:hypothetical protein